MKKVPTKNYFILLGIVLVTVIVTVALGNFYANRNRETSVLYNFLPKVTLEDLDTYLSESDTVAIYIDDKYNLEDNTKQEELKNKIIELNLSNNFVFLDSNNINKSFKREFQQKYHYDLTDDYPTIVVMNNRRVIDSYSELNVDIIKFEEFE